MELCAMRYSTVLARLSLAAVFVLTARMAPAQSPPFSTQLHLPAAPAAQSSQSSAPVRRLSVDEAVTLALEQNLGIQIERFNPQIDDLSIAQTRASWAPTLTSRLLNNSTDNPVTNTFSGGATKVTDGRFETGLGVEQRLPTGGNYSVSWNGNRSTSTNFFNNFDPQLQSNLAFNVTQPLLRNWKIDEVRQELQINQKIREVADVNLRATMTETTRNVKNAYWDLAFAVNNLTVQRQSLDLARRLLGDNEKRVQIGTMAPIDIVEAQSEVARNQESVIVAEAAIKQAEDRLRVLIFDPKMPDFWTTALEPSDAAPFADLTLDVDAAVQHAITNRSEVLQAKNDLQRNDITIRYLGNQVLPEVNAVASYGLVGVGGTRLQPLSLASLSGGTIPPRTILSQRGFGSVVGDVFTNAYPAWSFGLAIGYPIGTSASEANLAKARLQYSQSQTELRNTELQIAAQVRDAGRQVQTNRQRVDTSRVARELAERRLDAEEKKFAAGIQTTFFVFQAQRDLAQARTNEVKAILDYNKSQVDYEAVQEVPIR
jgi:outer membrane protein